MILRDPFHAKELGGAVSSIDREAVSGLEWQAGGLTADYGNSLGGLLAMKSKTPQKEGTLLGLSLTDSQILQQGHFANGRAHYVVSGRAGNLTPILEMIDFQDGSPDDGSQINSRYSDLFTKVHFVLNEKHTLAAHTLLAKDRVDYGEMFSRGEGRYDDRSLWVNLNSFWSDQLESQTHLSWSDYDDFRIGLSENVFGTIDYFDERDLQQLRLSQKWLWTLPALQIRTGWTIERQHARYNYRHLLTTAVSLFDGLAPSTSTNANFKGDAYGGFFASRFRLGQAVVAELGLRFDHQNWISQDQWSPRLNLAWTASPRTEVKFAAGRFYQPRQLYQLQVEDGNVRFEDPPNAKHFLFGLQHLLAIRF